jgi:hypothetical protein
MGGCNRCDGGSIRHTAGHGDTRSEKCPWCRIAELEAEMKRYADALGEERAKLARAKEWAIANDDEDYIDILSDTNRPLEVVEGWMDEWGLEDSGAVLGLYRADFGEAIPVTIIVMPKEDADGD